MIPPLHRLTTRRALRAVGVAPAVVRIVSMVSPWPDWYRWLDSPAHAQTASDEQGCPVDSAVSLATSAALLRSYCNRIASSDKPSALVWLGFAFHLVQDLASHAGRTHEEHAFDFFRPWRNPDLAPTTVRLGLAHSLRLLANLRQSLGRQPFAELLSADGTKQLSPREVMALLGNRDFRFMSLCSFPAASLRYLQLRDPNKRVRWDPETFFQQAFPERS